MDKLEKNSVQSKDRLLLIYKILKEIDENTAMTRDDIILLLEDKYNISVAKGSVTDDLKALSAAGLIMAKYPGKQLGRGVYGSFENNYFKAWQIKILIDVISQESFLEYSDIKKISSTLMNMTSKKEREIASANLSPSEKNYSKISSFRDNLSLVLYSIYEKKKIRFNYSKLDDFKRRKKDSKPARLMSPYSIKISDKFLYLIGYVENYTGDSKLKTYRLDHMYNIDILKTDRIPASNTPSGDLTEQIKNFHENNTNNFHGEKTVLVKVRINRKSGADANVLYDKMGLANVNPLPGEAGTFTIISRDTDGLYYNLLSLGDTIKVIGGSQGVLEKYKKHLFSMASQYDL